MTTNANLDRISQLIDALFSHTIAAKLGALVVIPQETVEI